MRFLSLFDGVYGFGLGLERAGMQCVGRAEIDPFCNALMDERRPSVPNYGDVRNVTKGTVEAVDLICGGFPCQNLSVAGNRAGLAGEKSGLWYEFHRIIAELRPRWVVIENVPGLLSSNGGRDMGTILNALAELRYGYAYVTLDAQYFGLAQRRNRVFIVANSTDWHYPAKILFEPESVPWNTPPSRETGEGASGYTPTSFGAYGEGTGTLRASSGDLGGGSETLIVGGGVNGQVDKLMASGIVGTIGARTCRSVGAQDAACGHILPVTMALNTRNNRLDAESQTLVAFNHQSGGDFRPQVNCDQANTLQVGQRQAVTQNSYVRRLTPLECERLQGFPDGWTDSGQSDTQRYKQLGNAVAVPVAEWLGNRIMQVEQQETP